METAQELDRVLDCIDGIIPDRLQMVDEPRDLWVAWSLVPMSVATQARLRRLAADRRMSDPHEPLLQRGGGHLPQRRYDGHHDPD